MKMIRISNATSKGYLDCCEGGVFDANYPKSKTRRGRVQEGGTICPTLTANEGNLILIEKIMEKTTRTPRPEGKGWCWDENNGKWFRIRKLTPRECFRLMDVSDADFDKLLVMETTGKDNKLKRVISDSQLYKMAGNSIVVACIDLIFENLFFPVKMESSLF